MQVQNPTAGLLGERTQQEQNRTNNVANNVAANHAANKPSSSSNTVSNSTTRRSSDQQRLLRRQQNFASQQQHVATVESLSAAVSSGVHQHEQSAPPAAEVAFGVDEEQQQYHQHVANPYLLTPLEVLAHRDNKQVDLTVVFDLDETLVYNRRMDIDYALLRPYALHLINALRHMANVEIVLWTASTRETAQPVVDQLHSRGHVFDDCIYRDSRWFTDLIHTKDLRLLGRDMSRVVIIDNQPNCVKLNPSHAILVTDYMGVEYDPRDPEVDASLINLYYIVEILLQNCNRGIGVPHTLQQLANEADEHSSLCQQVLLRLPADWARLSQAQLMEFDPLRVPPHGLYVRAKMSTPASLASWSMQ